MTLTLDLHGWRLRFTIGRPAGHAEPADDLGEAASLTTTATTAHPDREPPVFGFHPRWPL